MFLAGKIKKKIIKIVIIILIPVLLIAAAGGMLSLLANLEIIPSSNSASKNAGNVNVNMSPEVEELLTMSDEEVWRGLTGGLLSARPAETLPANADEIEAAVRKQIVSLEIPIRRWASGDDSNLQTVETTTTIQVNSFLEKLFIEFFQNVFDADPTFVTASVGGFRIDGTGYGQIGFRSAHTYGAAIDINWYEDGNPYGSLSDGSVKIYSQAEWEALPENHLKYQIIYENSPLVQVAHKFTLLWGGADWTGDTRDTMHFSFVADGRTREDRLSLRNSSN